MYSSEGTISAFVTYRHARYLLQDNEAYHGKLIMGIVENESESKHVGEISPRFLAIFCP